MLVHRATEPLSDHQVSRFTPRALTTINKYILQNAAKMKQLPTMDLSLASLRPTSSRVYSILNNTLMHNDL